MVVAALSRAALRTSYSDSANSSAATPASRSRASAVRSPRLEVVGGGGLEPRDRHPAREDPVAVKVEQPGQPGGEQAGQLAGGRLVADQQAPVARVVPLDGD